MSLKAWECVGCGDLYANPEIELATVECRCGVGAGRWAVATFDVADVAKLRARLAMATTFRTNGHIDHGFGVVLMGSRVRPVWKVSRHGWSVEYLSTDGQFRPDAYHAGVADFDSCDAAFAALDAARGGK